MRPDGPFSDAKDTVQVNPLRDDESDFRRDPKPAFIRLPEDMSYDRKLDRYADKGVVVSMEADDLQGEHRVVAEGILTEEECENLIEVAAVRKNNSFLFKQKISICHVHSVKNYKKKVIGLRNL